MRADRWSAENEGGKLKIIDEIQNERSTFIRINYNRNQNIIWPTSWSYHFALNETISLASSGVARKMIICIWFPQIIFRIKALASQHIHHELLQNRSWDWWPSPFHLLKDTFAFVKSACSHCLKSWKFFPMIRNKPKMDQKWSKWTVTDQSEPKKVKRTF